MQRLRLTFFAAPCLSVHRFPKDAKVAAKLAPVLTQDLPPLASLTISSDEISLVIPENVELPVAPSSSETGWKTFKVEAPLAAASIPVFAISTFDTDYILVKHDKAQGAIDAWHASGIASVSTA